MIALIIVESLDIFVKGPVRVVHGQVKLILRLLNVNCSIFLLVLSLLKRSFNHINAHYCNLICSIFFTSCHKVEVLAIKEGIAKLNLDRVFELNGVNLRGSRRQLEDMLIR